MKQNKLLEVEPKIRKFKCKGCEQAIYENIETGQFSYDKDFKEEIYPEYSELVEDWVCEGCYEMDNEHASTLVRYTPEEKEVVHFGDYVAYCEGDDIPDWFWKYFDKREWKSTDAWRGYYQTSFKNGFVKIANGWLTGYPSEAKPEKEAIELYEFLKENDVEGLPNTISLPAPLYWLFEPTSNVFSTASEIFCDKEDLPRIVEWLKNNGFEPDELNGAFG